MVNDKKILVIDDDIALCEVLQFLFNAEGFVSCFLNEGKNALSTAKMFKPDLILVDYLLPDYKGSAICSELKEWQPTIPVILYTAFCKATLVMNKCYDSVIEKPFDLDFLIQEIKRLLVAEIS